MNEHEKSVKAREQVEALTGLYVHMAVFAVVMAILTVINVFASSVWWVQWPLLGWGAGVLLHLALVRGNTGGSGFIRNWQLRKIRQLREKM